VALVVALAVIAAFAWLAAEWMESWGWGMFAAVLMIALLNRFFFPSEYRIDSTGISARHGLTRQRLRWPDVRRFVHDAHGGYLSTRARPSTLDAFRGVHLLFDRDRQTAIERIQRELSEQPQESAATASAREPSAPARGSTSPGSVPHPPTAVSTSDAPPPASLTATLPPPPPLTRRVGVPGDEVERPRDGGPA
jgi:hypothetical protein